MKTLSRTLPAATLLVAGLVLSGCGEATDKGSPASDGPTLERSEPSPTQRPVDGPVAFTEVAEFARSRMKPEQASAVVLLEEEADVAGWLVPLKAPQGLVDEVTESVRDPLAGSDDVYGLLLATGCQRPDDYSLRRSDGEISLRVAPVKDEVQCLVATTYLAVVTVDVSA